MIMRGNRVDNWMFAFWMLVFIACCMSLLLNIFLNFGSPEEIELFINQWHLGDNFENAVIVSFSVFIVSLILLVFKLFRWMRNSKRSGKLESFLFRITSLPDEEAVDSLELLGLVVSRKRMEINPRLFDLASPESLSHAVTFLLYLESRDSLHDWLLGDHNVFHHLADVLLENAPDESIGRFVAYMKGQKIYLGQLLDSALVRRELEYEANQLMEQIEAVIEQERSVLEKTRKLIETDIIHIRKIIPQKAPVA
jgi:signal transduction histidine kinase